jgi:hypothetical protein
MIFSNYVIPQKKQKSNTGYLERFMRSHHYKHDTFVHAWAFPVGAVFFTPPASF